MRRKPCFLPQHVTHSPCVTCIIPALASAGVGLGHRGRTEQLHGDAGCDACAAAARGGRTPHYRPGASIIIQGDHTDTLFVIRTGWVKITLVTADGHEMLLTALGPGEVFGEFEAIRSHGRAPRRQRRCARRGGVSDVHR